MSDILHAGPEETPKIAPEPAAPPALPSAPPPAPGGKWSPPAAGEVITDSRGRQLTLRGEISFLQEMDLRALAGASRADNMEWLTYVIIAARVSAIDDAPIAFPKSEPTLRAMLQQVDRSGVAALINRFAPPDEEDSPSEEAEAKN